MSDDTLLPAEADNSQENQPEPQDKTQEQPLILGKFKSNEDVIKSYTELEKRFGGFSGAPEAYAMPESVDTEDTFVKTLTELGKSANMGQETFSKLLELGEQIMSTKDELDREAQLEALGPEANQRIANIDGFMRNNLGDRYDDLKTVIKDAKSVELVEALIKATSPSKLPSGPSMPVNAPTQGEIERMMQEKGPDGRVLYHYSSARQKEVQDAIARMVNN